jgi:agmatine/peptidylarginine deiminase
LDGGEIHATGEGTIVVTTTVVTMRDPALEHLATYPMLV